MFVKKRFKICIRFQFVVSELEVQHHNFVEKFEPTNWKVCFELVPIVGHMHFELAK